MFELPHNIDITYGNVTSAPTHCYTSSYTQNTGLVQVTVYSEKMNPFDNSSLTIFSETFYLINGQYLDNGRGPGVSTSGSNPSYPNNCLSIEDAHYSYIPTHMFGDFMLGCFILVAILLIGLFKVFKR